MLKGLKKKKKIKTMNNKIEKKKHQKTPKQPTYLSTTVSKKQNKQISRTKTDSDTENVLMVARWKASWGDG